MKEIGIGDVTATSKVTELIRFVGGGESPVEYLARFDGAEYRLSFRFGELEIEKNGCFVQCYEIGQRYDSVWTEEDTIRILTLIGGSILRGCDLHALLVPKLLYKRALVDEALKIYIDRIEIVTNGNKLFPKSGQHRPTYR